MMIRWLRGVVAACALASFALAAHAQTEVSFYYPVAVGGPITKIIDGYAADFEKENPGIKLKRSILAATRNRSPRRSPP